MTRVLNVLGMVAILGVVVFGLIYGLTTPPTLGSLVVAVIVVVVNAAEALRDRR